MIISTPRITLRDFEPADRASFLTYQMAPRYRRLYDLDDDPARASELFDLFAGWRREEPRRNFQFGVFDARRDGPEWMRTRGWQEVDWALTRDEWQHSDQRRRIMPGR